jgi:hypothetical protein
MQRFIGVFILALTVALLGHPAVTLPPIALLPILAVLLPLASFYITVVPDEPELCRAQYREQQTRPAKCERRHPLQL